jgi:hypothetical protein
VLPVPHDRLCRRPMLSALTSVRLELLQRQSAVRWWFVRGVWRRKRLMQGTIRFARVLLCSRSRLLRFRLLRHRGELLHSVRLAARHRSRVHADAQLRTPLKLEAYHATRSNDRRSLDLRPARLRR